MLIDKIKKYRYYLKNKRENHIKNFREYQNYIVNKSLKSKKIPESFKLDNNNLYKLVYVNNLDSHSSFIQQSFILERPEGMSQEDCFKVISFIRQKLISNLNHRYINVIEYVLIKEYGFKALTEDEVMERTIVDLYFVDENEARFVNSIYYNKYFNWFSEDIIDEDEIEEIYNKRKLIL